MNTPELDRPVCSPAPAIYLEHAEDVLAQWLVWKAKGAVALVIVTRTEGGGTRAPGAMMAVSESGEIAGYVSGGCIDADVAANALAALRSGEAQTLRYGAGSPFIDIRLPCAGAIEVMIIPRADPDIVAGAQAALALRRPIVLAFSPSGDLSLGQGEGSHDLVFRYVPKLGLRIAGRGADALALARLATASGIATHLQLVDGEDVKAAARSGLRAEPLTTPQELPVVLDDAWTAFLLAFHETDWDKSLLGQALAGPAFYVGAVGSHRTHARRRDHLLATGMREEQVRRIRGPVGLVPRMRDASMLAISILAEVIEAFERRKHMPFGSTALVLLAAGESRRFDGGDKLLASHRGQRLLDHAGRALAGGDVAARLAVVGPDQPARAKALQDLGWSVTMNELAAMGQGTSLAAGIREADRLGAGAALVMLADMPNVPDAHLFALRDALTPDRSAVMSRTGDTPLPPAIFARNVFPRLMALTGDAGARRVFDELGNTATVALSPECAADVDTRDDLANLRRFAAASSPGTLTRDLGALPRQAKPFCPSSR